MKKPIVTTFGKTMKTSVKMFRRNKNTIKNLASSLQEQQMTTKHYFGSKTIKYFRNPVIKKFKYTPSQAVSGDMQLVKTGCKNNIQMKSVTQMNESHLRSLINMVSGSKPQLPMLITGGFVIKSNLFDDSYEFDNYSEKGESDDGDADKNANVYSKFIKNRTKKMKSLVREKILGMYSRKNETPVDVKRTRQEINEKREELLDYIKEARGPIVTKQKTRLSGFSTKDAKADKPKAPKKIKAIKTESSSDGVTKSVKKKAITKVKVKKTEPSMYDSNNIDKPKDITNTQDDETESSLDSSKIAVKASKPKVPKKKAVRKPRDSARPKSTSKYGKTNAPRVKIQY